MAFFIVFHKSSLFSLPSRSLGPHMHAYVCWAELCPSFSCLPATAAAAVAIMREYENFSSPLSLWCMLTLLRVEIYACSCCCCWCCWSWQSAGRFKLINAKVFYIHRQRWRLFILWLDCGDEIHSTSPVVRIFQIEFAKVTHEQAMVVVHIWQLAMHEFLLSNCFSKRIDTCSEWVIIANDWLLLCVCMFWKMSGCVWCWTRSQRRLSSHTSKQQ